MSATAIAPRNWFVGSTTHVRPAEVRPPATPQKGLSRDEFARMTEELATPLLAAALRYVRRRADAEDLVQETLFRALRGLPGYRRGTNFRGWMFRILHNVFVNHYRKETRSPLTRAVDPSIAEPAAPAARNVAMDTLADLPRIADEHFDDSVKRAVDELPDVYRVPFLLFSLGELSYQEIADTLGIPIGTVMSRLHRARNRLRAKLAPAAG